MGKGLNMREGVLLTSDRKGWSEVEGGGGYGHG